MKASVAKKVQAQQWAIINSNLNFAFGVEDLTMQQAWNETGPLVPFR